MIYLEIQLSSKLFADDTLLFSVVKNVDAWNTDLNDDDRWMGIPMENEFQSWFY